MDTANMAFSELCLVLGLSTYCDGDSFIQLDYESEVVSRVLRSIVFSQTSSGPLSVTAMITCFKRAPGGDFFTSPSGVCENGLCHIQEKGKRGVHGGV
jgi:hypothetical protein